MLSVFVQGSHGGAGRADDREGRSLAISQLRVLALTSDGAMLKGCCCCFSFQCVCVCVCVCVCAFFSF